jgi:opacity protein-like surface antigen
LYYYANEAYNELYFTQNATAQDGTAGPTGYGPASYLLGTLDKYYAEVGDDGANVTANWYGFYIQDQWKVTKALTVTAGLRYDFVSPPNYHKTISGLDIFTGQFEVTGPEPGFHSSTVPSGYFYAQANGWEPRFGLAYQAFNKTVVHAAFAMLDDHNNTLVQEYQDPRLSWPTGNSATLTTLDLGIPTMYANSLPAATTLYGPSTTPYASFGADPHNRIPYSMEFNAGVQQQVTNSITLNLDYVGSQTRHEFIQPTANTATIPGPGVVSARQPYPQYGGPFSFDTNSGTANYNALQAKLTKSLSHGLFFLGSYTWSKSLDLESSAQAGTIENVYNIRADYGPSDFDFRQLFVFSSVYQLPVGRGRAFLSGESNKFVQGIVGNWQVGSIVNLRSGHVFNAAAGGDIANVRGGSQRANKIGSPYAGREFINGTKVWLNPASFAVPAAYTFGNEGRNDLVGPRYADVDFNASKDFPIESTRLQFRAEAFNLFNHTNYGNPTTSVQSSSFGSITSSVAPRELQFAIKLLF